MKFWNPYGKPHEMNSISPQSLERLTDREREIFLLIGNSYTNTEIAQELGIAQKTVRNHIVSIYRILGTNKRADLIRHFGDI